MKFKLGIFDWNGTLLDDLNLVYGSVTAIFKYYNLKPPELATYREKITAQFMNFYYGEGIPKTATGDDLNKIRKEYFEKHKDEVMLNKNALATLKKLKTMSMKTAIVSGEMAGYLQKRLKQFEISHLFDKVCDGAYDKEKALTQTLYYFRVKPEESFYVDDTEDGIKAAKKVGIKTFGFIHPNSYHSPERILSAEPNYPIYSLDKIIYLAENQ